MNALEFGKQMLEAIPFVQTLGLEVLEAGDGRGTVRLPDAGKVHNHIGTAHAGALFTLAETASGAAVVGTFAEHLGEVTPLAKGAEISYLKIARGPITAKAQIVGERGALLEALAASGKVTCEVKVELFDESGVQVTAMTVHWVLRKNR